MANAAITVDLNAKIAQFETELKKATGSLDRFEKKSQQASAAIKNAFGTLGLTIGAGVMVRGIARMSDEFSSLQARLKLASRDTAEFNAANADLIRISQAAQAPLSETATLYTRIAASVKDLDVSQRAIADTTEAVALALKISGASGAEASSAMLQFSQAMASGVLRGEEFNSINEAAPRLLQALASSLKVPVGSLREMAKEGQLTRDVLIKGLLSELPKLQSEAETLPKTIGSAFTELNNKLLLTVGELNKVTGASLAVGDAISKIGTTGIEALSVLGANVAFVFKGIGNEIGGIGAQLSRLAVGDFEGFSAIGRMMKADAALARKELDEFEKKILGIGKTASRAASSGAVTAPTLGAKAGKKATGGAKSDPLASLLKSTDIGKTQEYNKLLGLLNARFDSGRKSSEQYRQALEKLNEQFGRASIDVFDSGSFKTTSKEVAEFIKSQQDAINGLNGEMAQEGVAAAEAFESALASLISDTTIVKTEELHKQVAILDKALFDGAISADIHAEALSKITEGVPEKLKETKSLAEELGMSFTSAFEDAIVGGKSFSDVLKGLEQDIIRITTRKLVTEPMGDFISGIAKNFTGSLFASANGNMFANGAGLSAYSGSVVSKPTVFPFASGMGLMGEAGPEAILPLKRGSDGKLGVAAEGGGTTVVMNISTPDANSFRASQGQITAQMTRALARGRRYT